MTNDTVERATDGLPAGGADYANGLSGYLSAIKALCEAS